MTPVLLTSRRIPAHASAELILAASIVRDAAEFLAEETPGFSEAARYFLAADRLTTVLGSPRVGRRRLLLTSPALVERPGRN